MGLLTRLRAFVQGSQRRNARTRAALHDAVAQSDSPDGVLRALDEDGRVNLVRAEGPEDPEDDEAAET